MGCAPFFRQAGISRCPQNRNREHYRMASVSSTNALRQTESIQLSAGLTRKSASSVPFNVLTTKACPIAAQGDAPLHASSVAHQDEAFAFMLVLQSETSCVFSSSLVRVPQPSLLHEQGE